MVGCGSVGTRLGGHCYVTTVDVECRRRRGLKSGHGRATYGQPNYTTPLTPVRL